MGEPGTIKLILASASPRRAEILRHAGFEFDIHATHPDETRFPDERAEDYVRRLAETKSRLAAEHPQRDKVAAVVIGADTAVVAENEILGKPSDAEDARRMLRLLSGHRHEVLTGISVLRIPGGPKISHVETTRVNFVALSETDIREYVGTGEPFDKAGAYGIQGIGGRFIWKIEGCYFNVMGLPLSRFWSALRAVGWTSS